MINKIFKSGWNGIQRLLELRFPDRSTKTFIQHNRNTWPKGLKSSQASGEVLFEYSTAQSAIIACSYLANVLAQKHNAKIRPYIYVKNSSKLNAIYYALFRRAERIFRSFGSLEPVILTPSNSNIVKASQLFSQIYPTIITKRDIEQITINKIRYGDLIYDDYLRANFLPTIDIKDEKFKEHLEYFLAVIISWEEYFDNNNIKAVQVSHCAYKVAIVSRLAISRNIPVYQANASHLYRMNKKNQNAYTEPFNFPENFRLLPKKIRDEGFKKAKINIERRFAGEVGVDMHYSSKSAYSKKQYEQLLQPTNRKKILIATHCFFDSPHPYGIGLFPDFFEWISYLGSMSEKTDYDWYIKTHPDFLPGNEEIIQQFLDKYKKFQLLPSDASHHQIIEEGINVALTVHGTIGLEYAALGVPVINASPVNLHNRYSFNFHPLNLAEYQNLLENLDDLKLNIKKEEIYEYYFMKNIHNSDNWLFENYGEMERNMGGYQGQFSSRIYDYFISQATPSNHHKIMTAVENFVESGEFRMIPTHFSS